MFEPLLVELCAGSLRGHWTYGRMAPAFSFTSPPFLKRQISAHVRQLKPLFVIMGRLEGRTRRRQYATSAAWPHKVFVSDPITDRRSTFQGIASHLPSSASLPSFWEYYPTISSRLKRATHRMYAYRILDTATGAITSGQDDGRESGSGDRLSYLLESNNCQNVILVVPRWYGGVQLGSNRWKWISRVAKEALERGGFIKSNDPDGIAVRRKR